MSAWNPDQEFLEFLLFIEKGNANKLYIDGKNPIDAVRDGTPGGRRFYRNLYESPMFQLAFQEWKLMMKKFESDDK